MPIEFRCTQCQKLLRTKDDTAGKQAKCPQCGTILTVPSVEASPEQVAPSIVETGNPYQSPAHQPIPVSSLDTATIIDFGDIFGRTWKIFKLQAGMCIAAFVVFMVLNTAMNFFVGMILGITHTEESIPVRIVTTLLTTVGTSWLQLGTTMVMLRVARGEPASLAEIFTGGPHGAAALATLLLFTLMFWVGFVLFIVPGIILFLMFSQSYVLVLDRGLGIMESFSHSLTITRGNKMTILGIYLVGGLVGFVLIVVTCCLGIFVVGPYMLLLVPVMYLAMTGQRTADQIA